MNLEFIQEIAQHLTILVDIKPSLNKQIISLLNQLSKLETRYNSYETALKDIASYEYKSDYCLSLQRDFSRLARETLISDEERQTKDLQEILKDFDKEVIIKVLEEYK